MAHVLYDEDGRERQALARESSAEQGRECGRRALTWDATAYGADGFGFLDPSA
jgi:hypothetical protein